MSNRCGLRGAFEEYPRFRASRSAWTPAYSRPRYRRRNAIVEQSLLEQLTLFSNVSIVRDDAATHRSKYRRRISNSATREQSHVIAGTVPECADARTQGRPVAAFRQYSILDDFAKRRDSDVTPRFTIVT